MCFTMCFTSPNSQWLDGSSPTYASINPLIPRPFAKETEIVSFIPVFMCHPAQTHVSCSCSSLNVQLLPLTDVECCHGWILEKVELSVFNGTSDHGLKVQVGGMASWHMRVGAWSHDTCSQQWVMCVGLKYNINIATCNCIKSVFLEHIFSNYVTIIMIWLLEPWITNQTNKMWNYYFHMLDNTK